MLAKSPNPCHSPAMIRKTLLLAFAGFLVCAPALHAQETPGEAPKPGDAAGPPNFWQARLPDGHFMVALDKITSISRHRYVLDGAVIVDEVTVDTVGQALARFYFLSPITDAIPGNTVTNLAETGRGLIEGATERAGVDVQKMVVKKYPDTTHAKSIEYRINSAEELKSLYTSVQTAWESGRGRQFTVK